MHGAAPAASLCGLRRLNMLSQMLAQLDWVAGRRPYRQSLAAQMLMSREAMYYSEREADEAALFGRAVPPVPSVPTGPIAKACGARAASRSRHTLRLLCVGPSSTVRFYSAPSCSPPHL